MAATSGNTYIEDGRVFTQAECDTYLAEINTIKKRWEWMTGVEGTYKLRTGTWNSSTNQYDNLQETSGDELTHTLKGAHEYYPAWRERYPDITEQSDSEGSASWGQWDYFTNRRSDWVAEAAQIKIDYEQMEATHTEMLATVD